MEILLETPPTFNFQRTALSHGWYGLLPFELNEDQWVLSRVFDVGAKHPIVASITSHARGLAILTTEQLSAKAVARLVPQVQHIMRLDDDMTGFYSLLEKEERLNWVAGAGAGRMLRSPTVFEDLIKTLCTTNCSNELDYFAHTIGFGVRYSTPVGPIRVDLGYQLNPPTFVVPCTTSEERKCVVSRLGARHLLV